MGTSKIADKLIVALVKIWENTPEDLREPGFHVDIWDLARAGGLLSKQEARQRHENYVSGAMDGFPSVQAFMIQREWVTIIDLEDIGGHIKGLYPTLKGIDYAHAIMRPLPVKIWGAIRQPTISIINAVIAAVIIVVITFFLTKYFLK